MEQRIRMVARYTDWLCDPMRRHDLAIAFGNRQVSEYVVLRAGNHNNDDSNNNGQARNSKLQRERQEPRHAFYT